MSKNWTIAPASKVLIDQINKIVPSRGKVSDGTIGDASHSARTSDHNPDDEGLVCARDITHDPVHGVDGKILVQTLTDNPDSRINYIIFDGKITVKGSNLQKWKKYNGANAHRHHVHISWFHGARAKVTKKYDLSILEDYYAEKHVEPVAVVLPEGEHLGPVDNTSSVTANPSGESSETNLNEPNPGQTQKPTPKEPNPPTDPIVVEKQDASIWAKATAIIATISAAGVNLYSMIETKINQMTPMQVLYCGIFIAAAAGGWYLWHKSKQRAHSENCSLIEAASNRDKNTVELK